MRGIVKVVDFQPISRCISGT